MDATSAPTARFIEPHTLLTHFHVRPGDVVADFGAGRGTFALALAKVVGTTGKVYACEIQKNLVETIADMARREQLGNVEVLWCDIETHQGSKLESESLDVALLINTLFQMEAKETAITEIYRTLRSGGKLFIVDWTDSFGGMGPLPEHVITEQTVIDMCESLHFVFERSYDAGDHHYGLAFRKP